MRLSNSSKHFFIRLRFLAIMVGIVLWVVTSQIVEVIRVNLPSWEHIFRNPTASYDQKMMTRWGWESAFLAFVRDNTPPDAFLLTPLWERPWLNQGNPLLLVYFLFPRRIYYWEHQYQEKIETNKAITHILVAWGKGTPADLRLFGWPKFSVNARKFVHLPTEREVFLAELFLGYSSSDATMEGPSNNLISSGHLLENYLSDSEKEIKEHRLLEFDDPLEYLNLTYTRNNYDYWTKVVNFSLADTISVRARIKVNIKHSVNLIAEVKYGNDKRTVFGSTPNREQGSWESLSLDDLHQRAERYGLMRDWSTKGMEITRIGINPGLPLAMPYLEKYGVIELERGQERERELETQVDCASVFLAQGNFHRARNEIDEAITDYQLSVILHPQNASVHFSLGEMYRKQGKLVKTIEKYQEAIELQPDIAWFHFALSEVYEEQGEADLARRSLQRAREIDPLRGL